MSVMLSATVGKNRQTGQNAPNLPDDVRKVQTLLRVAHQLTGIPPTDVTADGGASQETVAAIVAFQQGNLGFSSGLVEPNAQTLQRLNDIAAAPVTKMIRPGDLSNPHPFTIVIIANPALEAPQNSGTFMVDSISFNQAAFDSCVQYIDDVLFGNLPGQTERFITDPRIAPFIRVLSLFLIGLPAVDQNALVAQSGVSNLLIARREVFVPFLSQYGQQADIVYAVSQSDSHTRASAWYTSDDDARPGVQFTLDGVTLAHRHFNLIPGTVALHATSTSLTALHEFGHALSSYTNGAVVDLYVDNGSGLNNKRGRPIPANFATYNGTLMKADQQRDGLGYPAGWQSYHCELVNLDAPAVMDNYWLSPDGVPVHCLHDRITKQFLTDRLLAKISR